MRTTIPLECARVGADPPRLLLLTSIFILGSEEATVDDKGGDEGCLEVAPETLAECLEALAAQASSSDAAQARGAQLSAEMEELSCTLAVTRAMLRGLVRMRASAAFEVNVVALLLLHSVNAAAHRFAGTRYGEDAGARGR